MAQLSEHQALLMIREIMGKVGEDAQPFWAWFAINDIAGHALGETVVSQEDLTWGERKLTELGLIR